MIDIVPRGRARAAESTRVSRLDVLVADIDVAIVVGPVEGGTDDELLAVLREFGRRGPAPRVLLTPRMDARRWDVLDDVDDGFLRPGPDGIGTGGSIDDRKLSEALLDVLADDRTRPIQVGIRDGFLVHVFNHGMGDGRLALEVVVALSGAGSRERAEIGGAEPHAPLPRTILAIIRHRPVQFGKAVWHVGVRAMAARGQPRPGRDPAPNTALAVQAEAAGGTGTGMEVVVCRGEPGSLSRIDAARRARSSAASRGAVIAYHLGRGLQAAGVTLTDDIGVLVDVRERTSDAADFSMGNAFAVVGVPLADGVDLTAFGAAYHRAVSGENALARLLFSLTVRYPLVRLARRKKSAAAAGDAGRPAALTVSDVTPMPVLKSMRWLADPERPAVFAVASTPAAANHLAAYVTEARGRLFLSVSFQRSGFPREVIEAGLRDALGMLEDWCEGSGR